MSARFDRDQLLTAFERIAVRAREAGTRLEIAVYGGSALMLASNFRFATEDVDIASLEGGWPDWLRDEVAAIARDFGWSEDWLNDAVTFHLSPLADRAGAHVLFGTFPRDDGAPGLVVTVPTADYMLALKLKAIRLTDPFKAEDEASDIINLLRVVGVRSVEEAVSILGRYFPRSAADADKQRFLLRRVWPGNEAADAPRYPVGSPPPDRGG